MTYFKPRVFASLFVLLGCGAGFAAETPAQKAAHKVIAANYLRYGRAFEIKDLPAIMALTAPNYTSRGLRGDLQNRTEFEREMRAAFASAHRVSPASAQIQSFTWHKNEAIVVVKQRIRLVFLRNGKPRRYQNITLARDTWTQTPRGWQVRQSVTLAENVTLDGKKVAFGKRRQSRGAHSRLTKQAHAPARYHSRPGAPSARSKRLDDHARPFDTGTWPIFALR